MKLNGAATEIFAAGGRNGRNRKLVADSGDWGRGHADHFVQFYDDDDALIRSLGPFLGGGLGSGEAALVVATSTHRSALAKQLGDQGLDVSALQARGKYLELDAAETLAKFMVDGMPNPSVFEKVVGGIIEQLAKDCGKVRVFGEMVALLCDQKLPAAAICLEELWNDLGKKHRFSLFCAYPLKTFANEATRPDFAHICNAHGRVLPSEGYMKLDADHQLREVAVLQQKALSLEAEIALRRQLEDKLRRRESELTQFVENASIGLHWVGPDGIIQWANKADFEMLGYRAEEYIGRHIAEFHADKDVIDDILARLAADERLRDREARLRCKDGSVKTVLIDSSVLWENGNFLHTQCFTRDVTEKKRAEEALAASEERFRQLVSLMPAAVYACDEAGRITFYNQRAAELWGREPRLNEEQQKFCGAYRCWFGGQIIPPDQTPMAMAVREGKLFRDLEPEFEAPDGTKHSVLVNIAPLFDRAGKQCGAINVFIDVTERKRSDASAARLAAIVEHSEDAIFSTDLEGTITSWNRGAHRLYGYSAGEAIGRSVTLIVPEDRGAEEHRILERIGAGEALENFETVRRRKDGTCFHVSLTVSPVKGPNGKIIGVSKVARDITDKVRAKENMELMIAERTASLRDALGQMEEFSYSVSHDLRAPIRAIHAYATVLLEDHFSQLDEAARAYVKKIQRNSERMSRLTQDVLSYSRLARSEIRLEPISLEALVRDIIDQYENLQEPRAKVEVAGPLWGVLAHEVSLGQCVANILNNATKFVAPGITPTVRIHTEVRGNKVRLWFEDNGIGIKPEHQERIFQMFERVHPEGLYEGTGIGLTIVRKSIEKMGGRVGVESDGRNGSRFWFELHMAEQRK
jgi:PAS domain S-box-containing protein